MATAPNDLLAPRFLVHAAWADGFFSAAVKSKITNAPLVDDTRGCHACGQLLLRYGLVEGKDFRVVDAAMWASLQREYGADFTVRRWCATMPTTTPVVVKGEHVKTDTKRKHKANANTATAAPPPNHPILMATPARPLALDLYPVATELYYWDHAQDGAVACCHSACHHALLVEFTPSSLSSSAFCECARQRIASRVALDPTTREQVVRHRADVLVWHFSWGVWTLWRSHQHAFRLPADTAALRAPRSGTFRVCIRTRMKADETAAHVDAVKAAEAAYKKKKKKTTSQNTAAAKQADVQRNHKKVPSPACVERAKNARPVTRSAAQHAAKKPVSKKALGKRRRHERDADDDGVETKEADHDDNGSSGSCDHADDAESASATSASDDESHGVVDAAATFMDDSQATVDTQPDKDRMAAAASPVATRCMRADHIAEIVSLLERPIADMIEKSVEKSMARRNTVV